MNAPDSITQNILVREVNWLGDIVMSLPALRAVRKAHPQARLSVLIKKELASFFDGANWIDEIIPFKVRKGIVNGIRDRRAIVKELSARKFDLAVLLPNSFDSALWPAWAGIPTRAGYSRDARGFLLTNSISPSPQILEVHQVHYYLHMLKETLNFDGAPSDFAPDVSASNTTKMCQFLSARRKRSDKALIGLAVAAAYGPAKEWPATSYARLIDLIAERHGAECVLIGAPNERAKSEEVIAASKSGAILAAGETSVGEALALLALCSGFAGNDSGSMHVSGALGKPTVGIYGSTRADRTGPLGAKTKILYKQIECSPCLKRTCQFGHYDCLKMISPEEVMASLEELNAFEN